MAEIVAGFGSSHSPLMSLTGQLWHEYASTADPKNRELVMPPNGRRVKYDELLAEADPAIAKIANVETFNRRVENIQAGLNSLGKTFGDVNPDVVVMFGDDQHELMYYDNYPSISLYWGKTIKMIPRSVPETAPEHSKVSSRAYGTEERDWPVQSDLGLHLIESLMEREFDVAHSTYLNEEYGGDIGPATWYLDFAGTTKKKRQGLGHAFAFPINRWFDGKTVPIVPITINTCYPPNWISPKRAFSLGRAVREAIQSWDSDARVAIATSGGLSHFVVDEDLDRTALKGLSEANGEMLTSLPRVRLQSASTEILNWVAVAGAMGDTPMEVVTYEAGYRTPAGTGCGCACGQWIA
jgi:3-O-methylgallate 3,4-dioxygenase